MLNLITHHLQYIKEENEASRGETFYKLGGLEEFNFLDGYEIDYKLKRFKK